MSDIHFDLRPEFEHHGLAPYIDEYVLSFEHGVQKPDRRIFEIALSRLGISPDETLMVGDRASHDGGAAVAGIPTLLLPPLPAFQPRGLSLVLRAAIQDRLPGRPNAHTERHEPHLSAAQIAARLRVRG